MNDENQEGLTTPEQRAEAELNEQFPATPKSLSEADIAEKMAVGLTREQAITVLQQAADQERPKTTKPRKG
jgi:alkylhydroperoxidase family enzyme